MNKLKLSIVIVLTLLVSNTFSQTTTWNIDPVHSKIGISVTHLIISEVEGRFNEFSGTLISNDNDFSNSKIDFTVKTSSIFTDNTKRDNHLKSDDFFSADKYPEITFKSTSFNKIDDNKYKLKGDFTINQRYNKSN